ncbi:hypothetical protein [Clostridium thermarum]|uniref:hypothetical protein n=1 Tax=Clostridium thermarum TaxID=1716543 RepID=UPI0011204141|nr:hypothetical protein [Clostridium thermarum]
MFTVSAILQMLFTMLIVSFILSLLLVPLRISNVKVMLLGIGIIVFSNSVLKGMIKYGIDELISVIGLSFCIVGFIKKDNERERP